MTIMMGVALVNSAVCFWAANNAVVFFGCVMMNYFSLGGLFAVFPRTVMSTFGKQHGPQIYAIILLGSLCNSIVILIQTKLLLPSLGFAFMYYLGSAVTVLSLVLIWWYKEELDIVNLGKARLVKRKTE